MNSYMITVKNSKFYKCVNRGERARAGRTDCTPLGPSFLL